jgi:hypothetical protein
MVTCAIKGTGKNKGFGQIKTLFSKKIPNHFLRFPTSAIKGACENKGSEQ